jgi:hypothetical protein
MTFRVGQKVVCILNQPWRPQRDLVQMPFYNGVYTIAEIRVRGEEVGLRFFEIQNPPTRITDTGQISEPCFDAKQFRPIVSRKTDISCFTVLLNPSKERENV